MYFKITNANENHRGFQYVDGLNVLIEEFNDDPNKSCCRGGLYFTNIQNIFKFLDYGIYLREIALPIDNPDFRMVKDPKWDKWRANMIILGTRYDLNNVDTFKYLIQNGANIHVRNDYALRWSAGKGYLDVIKFLIENRADIHANDDSALKWSAERGHLDVVKFLIENGADIHAENDYALTWSEENGYLDVANFLVENGANDGK